MGGRREKEIEIEGERERERNLKRKERGPGKDLINIGHNLCDVEGGLL